MKIFSPLRRDFSAPAELASHWAMLDELGSVLDGTFKEFEPDFDIPRTFGIKFGMEARFGGSRGCSASSRSEKRVS